MIEDIVPRNGGRVFEVRPERPMTPCAYTVHGTLRSPLFTNEPDRTPKNLVFTLPRARLLGPDGFVVSAMDEFVYDASFSSNDRGKMSFSRHPLYRQRKKPWALRKICGRVLSLATDFAVGSFGHFFHDGISRFPLVLRAGLTAADFDWLYMPRLQTVATDKIVAQLGFRSSQILNYEYGFDLEVEEVCATSYPCSVGFIDPDTGAALRHFGDVFRSSSVDYPKRIVLSRQGYKRSFANSQEIEAVFLRHGFHIVDAAREPNIVEFCANADVIAGIDGSNMGNLGLAREGAIVLLIIPPVFTTPPYHVTTAVAGGRELHVMQGDPLPGQKPDYHANFSLNSAALDLVLSQII